MDNIFVWAYQNYLDLYSFNLSFKILNYKSHFSLLACLFDYSHNDLFYFDNYDKYLNFVLF